MSMISDDILGINACAMFNSFVYENRPIHVTL